MPLMSDMVNQTLSIANLKGLVEKREGKKNDIGRDRVDSFSAGRSLRTERHVSKKKGRERKGILLQLTKW